MKFLHQFLGILFSLCLMIILLITSVEAVAYWTPGYYESEYTKYKVTDDVQMNMEDLLYVTDEMMSYLRGNRDNLHIITTINGIEREFFNSREIAHMEDVKHLFLAAISLRRFCIAVLILCIVFLRLLKAEIRNLLPRMLCAGTILFFTILSILGYIISTDFSKYFIIFHKIFFSNDLWILDPTTDLLINIVPEPFFVDTALRIGITFGLTVSIVFISSMILIKKRLRN